MKNITEGSDKCNQTHHTLTVHRGLGGIISLIYVGVTFSTLMQARHYRSNEMC